MFTFTLPNGFTLGAPSIKDLEKLASALPSIIATLPEETKQRAPVASATASLSPSPSALAEMELPNVLAWQSAHAGKRLRMTGDEQAQFSGMPKHLAREETAKARLIAEGLPIVESGNGSASPSNAGTTIDIGDIDLAEGLDDGTDDDES